MRDTMSLTEEAVSANLSHPSARWLCHDPLLDPRLWHADVPDTSVCLQKTILLWLPCSFLWLCAPIVILSRLRSSKQVTRKYCPEHRAFRTSENETGVKHET